MDLATKNIKKKAKKIIKIVGISILFAAAIVFAIFTGLKFSFFSISGNSMEPYLSNGDSIIIKQDKGVERDQLFFFTKPSEWKDYKDPERILVKRIAATGGDTLKYDGKAFTVNDEVVYDTEKENYECSAGNPNYEYTLAQNQILVFGDNAKESLDSRTIFCDGNENDIFVTKKDYLDYGTLYKKF